MFYLKNNNNKKNQTKIKKKKTHKKIKADCEVRRIWILTGDKSACHVLCI